MKYRTDIDGLRALAVISVILFHLGFLPNGYLGVDVFFVISGYLITSIVYHQSEKGKFSIVHFYERRIRRIIPLLLFITGIALVLGLLYMLPDDLENLSQGVVASNVSLNNILMYITSSDYWAVKNEYKPLMHTWSLGIEEQFYLLYPFLFFFFNRERIKYVKGILIGLTLVSIVAFLLQTNVAASFYFIQYRFFELSIGGLGAILFTNTTIKNYQQGRILLYVLLALTAVIMYAPVFESNTTKVLMTTLLTVGVLITGKQYFDQDPLYQAVMANPVVRFIGNISFSLYMWHQLVFAFARYAFVEEITPGWAVTLSLITLVLSVATYYGIENPFRKPQVMKTRTVLLIVGTAFMITTGSAFYIYTIGGVVKDYPELNLYRTDLGDQRNFFSGSSNIHIAYNEKVRKLDRGFSPTNKTKVLVIGNSFGRDIANVLMESAFADDIEVRYFEQSRVMTDDSLRVRFEEADRVILGAQGAYGKTFLQDLGAAHGFTADPAKVWVFGTKDFGFSNGIHYNRMNEQTDYSSYRTVMKAHALERNRELQEEWKDRYIDLIAKLADDQVKDHRIHAGG